MSARTSVPLFEDIYESELVKSARIVCERLKNAGHECYFAGGCVRDILLNPKSPPKDIDIATSAGPEAVQKIFSKSSFVGQSFGVCMVNVNGHAFEVATFRKDGTYSDRRHPDNVSSGNQHEDSQRRDFTINAMYFDPIENVLVDFHDGQADLKNRLLRCVGIANDRLHEDPLRIIRLFRFAARFDFQIEAATALACKSEVSGLDGLSRERILMEIEKVPDGKLTSFVNLTEQSIGWSWLVPDWQNAADCEASVTIARHADYPMTCLALIMAAKKCFVASIISPLRLVFKTWPSANADAALFGFLFVSLQSFEFHESHSQGITDRQKKSKKYTDSLKLILLLKRIRHISASRLGSLALPFFASNSCYFSTEFVSSDSFLLLLKIFKKLVDLNIDTDCASLFEKQKQFSVSHWSVPAIMHAVEQEGLPKAAIANWVAIQSAMLLTPEEFKDLPAEGSKEFLSLIVDSVR